VFLYDGHPGGVGLCEKAFALMESLLEKTRRAVAECPCEAGCPSCIHSPKCGSGNVPLDKAAAVRVLDLLTRGAPPAPPAAAPAPAPAPPPEAAAPARPDPAAALKDRRVLVLDVETQRSAEEVGGWSNCHLMRVAVAVTWDTRREAMTAWGEAEVPALLEALAKAELVVGFNIDRFDLGVLRGYARPEDLRGVRTFDILADVAKRLGFRVSLGALATETLGRGKTADGLQSLAWFRAGEVDKVREYCEKDVEITRDVFLFGLRQGHLLYARKGERVRLAVDWDLAKLLP
jgi:DEAD/DEAH box helicase domain-containing protein